MEIKDIKTPEDIVTFIHENIKYGWLDIENKEHIHEMKNLRRLYRTSTVEECLEHKIGTCLEQTNLTSYLLDQLGIPNKKFCSRVYEGENFNNLEAEERMHFFVLYYLNGKVYQIENINWETQGINEYNSEEEAIEDINSFFINQTHGKGRKVVEYKEIAPGLSVKELNLYINSLDKGGIQNE